MKNSFLIGTITLTTLFTANTAISQAFGGSINCPQKELIKRYTEITDSAARFLGNLKKTSNPDDYESFENAIARDSIEAFNVFGIRSTGLKDSMNALTDSLGVYALLLRNAIDPDNLMTVGRFFDTLSSRITCFLNDITINNLEYLLEQCFGSSTSTNRMAGPCEEAFAANLVSARANFQTGLASCVSAVACQAGWWRFVCLGLCYTVHSGIYNEAKSSYFCIYLMCRGLECPPLI